METILDPDSKETKKHQDKKIFRLVINIKVQVQFQYNYSTKAIKIQRQQR